MKKCNVMSTNQMSPGTPGRACRVLAASVLASLAHILATTGGVQAQDPSVRAYADPPEVAAGDQFRLVVEISGAETIESVTFPERFDFVQSPGRSGPTVAARVGNAEGRGYPSMFTLTYAFVARDPGLFEVGPFLVFADGQSLETEPVAVLVNREGGSEVVVRARVEPSRVLVGDEVTVAVEVVGSLSDPEFIAPDVFDFARLMGPTGSMSSTNRNWRIDVFEEGEFIIPPIRVVDDHRTYESEPLTLVVGPRPVSVEATLESESIWIGGEFVLEVEVTGVGRLDEEPATPLPDAVAELLEVDERSSDFMEERVDRTYRFRARQAGEFEIGPMRIVANGQTVESNRVSLVVDEVPTGDGDPADGLFFMGAPDKSFAYVNEPVVVEYSIASEPRTPGPWIGTKSWPSFEDFVVVELNRGRFRREVVVDGRSYQRRLVRRVALLPRRAGQLDVAAVTVEARVMAWGLAAARGREWSSTILTTEPHTLEVLPLPEERRPASFRGHVGTLEAVSWVDRNRAEVGEVVTLQVEVSVEGAVEALPDPEIDFPDGFEVFSEPESGTDAAWFRWGLRGTRTYTYRLTATTPGTYLIPAIEMSYFDPETESYGTTRGHPFTVTVVPAGAEAR